jgi:hypothetical protein
MTSVQPLSVLWERDVDVASIEHHNASHPELIVPGAWSVDWVLQTLLAPSRVRPSRQEEEALQNFERSQRHEKEM